MKFTFEKKSWLLFPNRIPRTKSQLHDREIERLN